MMPNYRFAWIGLLPLLATLLWVRQPVFLSSPNPSTQQVTRLSGDALAKLDAKMAPAEHYFQMRSWPDGEFSLDALQRGMAQARADYRALQHAASARGGGPDWQVEGPMNIGGRINTIAVHPTDNQIIYVGCASGGIFKTTDGGANWAPIFDDQPYLPIGDIEIDPNNPDIVYAGTGDPNVSGYPFIGDGLYRSTDAGATWTHLGLEQTRIISRVRVHPLDPDLIYVGAMGLPFEKNGDRGVYKSTDGGANWSQVLYLSDSTGVCDLLIDESNVNRVWAAGWDRLRSNYYTIVYGPGAKIYRTTDGGSGWTALAGGLPTGEQCRIGLDQEPGNPNHLIAQYIGTDMETQGVYESFNGGSSWLPYSVADLNSSSAMGGFGWYFAKVRFNPYVSGQVWVCGINLWRTNNSGTTWTNMTFSGDVHADKHDLVFLSASEALLATDGGLYRTTSGGAFWTDAEDIPNTQFYHIQINPHTTAEYWGGAQDNGTSRGNAAAPSSWERMLGGDGFHTEFNQSDPDVLYAETQNGDIWFSENAGVSFDWGSFTLPFGDRRNWDMPYILSPHNPLRMYAGTYRLHRSEGVIPGFTAISGDLTRGVLTDPRFHNLTTLRESPVTEGLLYTGSSDGRVNRSEDGGAFWSIVSGGLPNRYVTDLECSFQNSDGVFVTHSGYKDNDFSPLVHYSSNRGTTWQPIRSDLPQLGINDLEVYPGNDSILFVANDGGVYFSTTLGASWSRLGGGMPVVNVYDIELDTRTGKLIAGTHGRSMMSLALRDYIPSQLQPEAPDTVWLCEGESATILVSGALSYAWSPAGGLSCTDCSEAIVSPSTSTTYTVTFNDGLGHEDTRAIRVEIIETPKPEIAVLADNNLQAIAPGALSYTWFFEGELIASGEADSIIYAFPGSGDYTVQVQYPNGCSAISDTIFFGFIGLDEPWTAQWSAGPNPFSGEVVVQLPLAAAGTYRLRWYAADGRLLAESRERGGSLYQATSGWAPGLYYLRVDAGGRSQTVKLYKP